MVKILWVTVLEFFIKAECIMYQKAQNKLRNKRKLKINSKNNRSKSLYLDSFVTIKE